MRKSVLLAIIFVSIFLSSVSAAMADCSSCVSDLKVWRYCGNKVNGWCQDNTNWCGWSDYDHECWDTKCVTDEDLCEISCGDFKREYTCTQALMADGSECCWITGKDIDGGTDSECVEEDFCDSKICADSYCSPEEDCCLWEDEDIGTKKYACYDPTLQECTMYGVEGQCVKRDPAVIVTSGPSNIEIEVGDTNVHKVDFKIRNDDTLECSKSKFYMTFLKCGSSGWQCRFDNVLEKREALISPWSTSEYFINVHTPDSGAIAGEYEVEVQTTRGSNVVKNTVTFTVTNCGNHLKDQGEDCDKALDDQCIQEETSKCDPVNRKYGTRGVWGTCNDECECVYEDFTYGEQDDQDYCDHCEHAQDSAINCGEGCEPGTEETKEEKYDYNVCDGAVCRSAEATITKKKTCSDDRVWGEWVCEDCPVGCRDHKVGKCDAEYCGADIECDGKSVGGSCDGLKQCDDDCICKELTCDDVLDCPDPRDTDNDKDYDEPGTCTYYECVEKKCVTKEKIDNCKNNIELRERYVEDPSSCETEVKNCDDYCKDRGYESGICEENSGGVGYCDCEGAEEEDTLNLYKGQNVIGAPGMVMSGFDCEFSYFVDKDGDKISSASKPAFYFNARTQKFVGPLNDFDEMTMGLAYWFPIKSNECTVKYNPNADLDSITLYPGQNVIAIPYELTASKIRNICGDDFLSYFQDGISTTSSPFVYFNTHQDGSPTTYSFTKSSTIKPYIGYWIPVDVDADECEIKFEDGVAFKSA